MSNKEVCDFCGEEAGDGAAGWYRVSMQGKTEDDWEYADFCSLSCLFDWASRRIHHHSYGKPAEPPKEVEPAKAGPFISRSTGNFVIPAIWEYAP